MKVVLFSTITALFILLSYLIYHFIYSNMPRLSDSSLIELRVHPKKPSQERNNSPTSHVPVLGQLTIDRLIERLEELYEDEEDSEISDILDHGLSVSYIEDVPTNCNKVLSSPERCVNPSLLKLCFI
ncbi:hypothetical protein EHI8A_203700 [Entamoeba histolytica HM-1:IMSS-B]|uniref:Uncharacterized protein n=6 Tax=Entamoeba histolytica TaxID=5759 RepID=C4MBH8_ENTH1|nr:hypothetical protein EHI_019860 [Entamoeba histolytica HM-1:IMSS]EMD44139.1 Hypothetical protein EHI5A_145320 [Entamoeba histolytica KU27]EMH78020.1 hypothetical protein EHI8A_203700 [Entamoeba histolytica HM-1:IMSS-B]EMS14880.1 hypothetical protein KM1_249370 [Entamoeba histolytica HM-3:IMSS]ENY65633.1 hypothetical protein EHI7A_179880 [Entamoeba histolytica HM-1:IMSS-A]GAT99360.1 hypothetical protein CL6EHI_019860 [Entamoeba histolytica]|eukprot:XP_648021.2 hypothetical protein EHI_019860 [Entamoeba histolytica HM-1:IMSS]